MDTTQNPSTSTRSSSPVTYDTSKADEKLPKARTRPGAGEKSEVPPPSSPSEPPVTEMDEDEAESKSEIEEEPEDDGEDEVEEDEAVAETK